MVNCIPNVDKGISSPTQNIPKKTTVEKIKDGAFIIADETATALTSLSKIPDPYGAHVAAGLVATFLQQVVLAEANRKQLAALARRVETVVPFLQRINQTRSQQNVKATLTIFNEVIKECIKQAQKFGKKNFAIKILQAGTDQEKFLDLNKRLNEAIGQLDFGLSIEANVMLEQNMKDSLADKKEIIANVGEVLDQQKLALESNQQLQNQQQEFILAQKERNAILAAQLQSMHAMLAEKLSLQSQEKHEFLKLGYTKLQEDKQFSTINIDPGPPKPPIDDKLLIPLHEITIQQKIATGSFGSIYQGIWCKIPVVVKKASSAMTQKEDYEKFIREVNIMAQLRNPYITQLFGACLEPQCCLIMEYMEKGSLEKLLEKKTFHVEEQRSFAVDIAKGLLYLHTRDVKHRDLRTANILVNAQNLAKLTEFRLSKTEDQDVKTIKERSLAIQWMAPETLSQGIFSQESDVYSYGMVLWSISTGKKPFANLSNIEISNKVFNGESEKIDQETHPAFQPIIEQCWNKSPMDRPGLSEMIDDLENIEFKKQPTPDELFAQAQAYEQQKDFVSAAKAYHLAAEVGFPKAGTYLANLYLTGQGVNQDKKEASIWLLHSAKLGHNRAQYNLAAMLERGDGIPQNLEEALHWYQEAAKQNTGDAAKKVQDLQKKLNNTRI